MVIQVLGELIQKVGAALVPTLAAASTHLAEFLVGVVGVRHLDIEELAEFLCVSMPVAGVTSILVPSVLKAIRVSTVIGITVGSPSAASTTRAVPVPVPCADMLTAEPVSRPAINIVLMMFMRN